MAIDDPMKRRNVPVHNRRAMNLFSLLEQKEKKELYERFHHLQEALENQKLATNRCIEALAEIASVDQSLTESLNKGLRLVLQASHLDAGCIHILDQEKRVLKLKASLGLSSRTEGELETLGMGEKIPGQVLQKGEALFTAESAKITDFSGDISPETQRVLLAGFPLKWKDKTLGVLTVMSKNDKRFSEDDLEILENVSRYMAVIVQNLILFDIISQGKSQWEIAVDSIPDLVLICDPEFRIIKINKTIFDRFYLPLEEAIGKECFELLYDGQSLPITRNEMERMLKRGVTHLLEVTAPRWKGMFSIIVSPILSLGEFVGSIHVIKEITQ